MTVLNAFYATLLLVYAFDSHRTIQRFGGSRTGVGAALLTAPGVHIFVGAVLSLVFVNLIVGRHTPIYFGVGGLLVSIRYLVESVRFHGRKKRARFEGVGD
jgi:hypothetical protein